MADNLGGMWRGEVTGTNEGEVRLIISDDEGELDGRIEFNDRRYGRAEFMHSGTRNQDGFVISIRPTAAPLGVVVPSGMIRGRMDSTGALVGIWETTIGSEAQEKDHDAADHGQADNDGDHLRMVWRRVLGGPQRRAILFGQVPDLRPQSAAAKGEVMSEPDDRLPDATQDALPHL